MGNERTRLMAQQMLNFWISSVKQAHGLVLTHEIFVFHFREDFA